MNLAERNARTAIAIKMMDEVIEDAKTELREEGGACWGSGGLAAMWDAVNGA